MTCESPTVLLEKKLDKNDSTAAAKCRSERVYKNLGEETALQSGVRRSAAHSEEPGAH